MRVVSAQQALADFGRPGRPAAGAAADAPADATAQLEARIIAAREEGLRVGRSEAEARLQAERQRLEEEHARALAEAQARWQEETGRRLAEDLEKGLGQMRRALEEALAEILEPLLEDAARQRALAGFAAVVSRMMAADEGLRLRVKGDPSMLEALSAALGEEAEKIAMEAAPGSPELTTHVDSTVIRTALEEWRATLAADEAG